MITVGPAPKAVSGGRRWAPIFRGPSRCGAVGEVLAWGMADAAMGGLDMAKGGREQKKPKKEVAKSNAAAPSTKGTSSVTIGKQTAKK